jgi:hypothetical protein
MIFPEMRSPAARGNADRAEVVRSTAAYSIGTIESEADFALLFVARRNRVPFSLARAIVALAGLARAFA